MKYIITKDDNEYLSTGKFLKLSKIENKLTTGEHPTVLTSVVRGWSIIKKLQINYPNSTFKVERVYGYTAYRIRNYNE